MRILFVTHHYLSGKGGGIFASRSFINALAETGAEVTLLYPVKGDERAEEIDPRVRAIPVPYAVPRWKKGLDLLLGRIHRYFGVLEPYLDEGYDQVVFDTCYPSFRMLKKVRKAVPRIVTIHHNCQWEYARDNTSRALRPLMLFWLRRCEGQAVRGSDLNLTLTPEDRELLYQMYDPGRKARIEVVGVHEYQRRPLPPPSAVTDPVFVISGNLGAKQTEDALLPWIRDCYPVVKQRVPDAHMILSGQAPSERLAALCRGKGIELIPFPPEVEPILRRARYYICPTDRGGGIKLRIMDGLSHGLPVLTHAVSARGYHRFVGKGLFVYEDAASFGKALDEMLSSRIDAEAVRRCYEETFSFDACVAEMKQYLSV